MVMKIGPAVISDGQPWNYNRDVIRRIKPEIVRVRTPLGFSFTPAQLQDIITDNPQLKTIVLCTEDGNVSLEQVDFEIVGRGFREVVKRRPIDVVLELGNEPNLAGVSIWQHRLDALRTLTRYKQPLNLPNLRWSVSLPTTLSDTIDLLARDEHGCILDHIDVHTAHWYGWHELGDGAGDGGKWNDILTYLIRHTTLPILITEAGIDDRATPRDEKARRYLRWAESAHPRIEGVCLWGVGDWSNGPGRNPSMEIDPAMADVLGSRHTEPQQPPTPEPEPTMTRTLGATTVSEKSARAWLTKRGAHQRMLDVLPIIYELAPIYEVPAETAVAQTGKETAYGHFAGVVPSTHHNWCGLKVASGGSDSDPNAHQRFKNDRDGLDAYFQHIARYGGKSALPAGRALLDPRWHLVTPGSAPNLEDLGGKWAPAADYGRSVANLRADLITFAKSQPEQEQPMSPYPFIRGLIDIRGQLPRRYDQGENRHIPLSQKVGAVVHYSGPPVNLDRSDLAIIKSEAEYHVTKNWGSGGGFVGGDGYMYAVVIGRNGEKWLCRDLESVLWHCGAWPQNGTALSVHVPIGGNQRATKPQLQAMAEVLDDWYAAGHGNKRTQTWGHQELQSTDCPGTLQWEFVIPYREGKIVTTEDTSIFFGETGHGIGGGFYQWWKRNNGMITLGFSLSPEFDVDDESAPAVPGKMPAGKRRMQVFQGGVLLWLPELESPWDVQRVHVTHPRFMEFVNAGLKGAA